MASSALGYAAPAPAPPAARTRFCAHRADGATTHTLLSVLDGAHRTGGGVLGFFDTRAARALRLVSEEAREAVASAPWFDKDTRILRHLGRWRASFPHARAANISVAYGAPKNTFASADFAHLAGVHTLNMALCDQATITDAAFAHLAGVHTLDMRGCDQVTITDAAFAHLAGIDALLLNNRYNLAAAAALGARLLRVGGAEDD